LLKQFAAGRFEANLLENALLPSYDKYDKHGKYERIAEFDGQHISESHAIQPGAEI